MHKDVARNSNAPKQLRRRYVISSRRRVAVHNEPAPDKKLSEDACNYDYQIQHAPNSCNRFDRIFHFMDIYVPAEFDIFGDCW